MATQPPTARSRLRLVLTVCFYATALILGVVAPLADRSVVPSAPWLAFVATLVLYAVGSTIALARKPGDPRVGVFVATGVLVTMSILMPRADAGMSPRWLAVTLTALRPFFFLINFAVFVHLAAMIPHRNPIVARHPAFISGNYLAGAALSLVAAVGSLNALFPDLPWRIEVPLFQRINGVTYLYAGLVCLMLLRHAALHEQSAAGRRQALVVFFAVLPWTLNLAGWLLLPRAIYPLATFFAVEPFVIALVPAGFLLAILGLRLFEIGSFVRKGLIYGLTTGLFACAIYVSMVGASELLGQALGVKLRPWHTAVLLVLTGAAVVPLLHRVTRAVDSLFFPEKLELARLQRSVIPRLAGFTGIDAAASRFVSLIRDGLRLSNASLLVADESRAFFRVRARVGEFSDPRAGAAVVTRDDLRAWLGEADRAWRVRRVPEETPSLPPELRRMLRLLDARVVVPVGFHEELVGILVLGGTGSEAKFDAEDRHSLEDVARQASAMLENARLFDLATRDPLTSLSRRQVFEDRLAQEIERCRRWFEPFAVGLADLDGFKRINDTRGHLAGDQALRAITAELMAVTRRSDTVARYGGEEFAFLFSHASHDGTLYLAEALRQRIEALVMDIEGGPPLSVTISMGIHIVRPEDVACSPADLIRLADRALYEAKALGGNRVVLSEWKAVDTEAEGS